MNAAELLPLAVVIIATCCAAVTDIRTFKIHHNVTVPLLLTGIAFRSIVGGWVGLGDSLAGAFFGFSSLLVFYLLGGMGAGDVKLMAGVCAWLGMPADLPRLFGRLARSRSLCRGPRGLAPRHRRNPRVFRGVMAAAEIAPTPSGCRIEARR